MNACMSNKRLRYCDIMYVLCISTGPIFLCTHFAMFTSDERVLQTDTVLTLVINVILLYLTVCLSHQQKHGIKRNDE